MRRPLQTNPAWGWVLSSQKRILGTPTCGAWPAWLALCAGGPSCDPHTRSSLLATHRPGRDLRGTQQLIHSRGGRSCLRAPAHPTPPQTLRLSAFLSGAICWQVVMQHQGLTWPWLKVGVFSHVQSHLNILLCEVPVRVFCTLFTR